MKMPLCILSALLVFNTSLIAQESTKIFDAPLVVTDQYYRMDDLGDMDADGDLDGIGWWWLTTDRKAIYISIIENQNGQLQYNGRNKSLSVQAINGMPPTTWDSTTRDLDGDGRDEYILAIGHHLRLLSRWGTTGTLKFDLILDYSTALNGVTTGDFDNDGDIDFAVSDDAGLRYFLQGPTATFSEGPTISSPGIFRINTADVTGDGVDDVVAMGAIDLKLFSLVSGAPVLINTLIHGVPQSPVDAIKPSIGDVNGDNKIDITIFNHQSFYSVISGQGGGVFSVAAPKVGGPADRLADVDGDGDLDGVCCGGGTTAPFDKNLAPSTFMISHNDGSGNFAPALTIPGLGAERLAGAVDVDGDGDVDLIGGRCVYYAEGPIMGAIIGQGPQDGVGTIGALDLDGDFDFDLADNPNSMLINSANGEFSAEPTGVIAPPNNNFVNIVCHGDFNGDGHVDFVCENRDTLQNFLHMRLVVGNGNGGFEDAGPSGPALIYFANGGSNPTDATFSLAADVDNDGDKDIIAGCKDLTDNCRIWLNDGQGTFSSGPIVGRVNRVDDLDDDQLNDLILIDSTVCWGMGGANFTAPHNLGGFASLTNELYDLNGDGRMDLVYLSYSGLRGYRNLGNRNFAHLLGPTTVNYVSLDQRPFIGVFDFDDNGILDFVHNGTVDAPGTLIIRKNTTMNINSASTQGSQAQLMSGHALCDIDNDGDMDLVGKRIYKNLSKTPANSGLKRQYGEGTKGSGGFIPRINAVGKLGFGDITTLKITGTLGQGQIYLAFGLLGVNQPGVPIPSLNNYSNASVIMDFFAYGAHGIPGAGVLDLSYPVPALLSGVSYFMQIYCYDPAAIQDYTCSGGLEIRYQ